MHVLAVGRDHVITRLGRAQRTDRHGLLSRIEMQEASDFAGRVLLGGGLFEVPRKQHVVEKLPDEIASHAGSPFLIRGLE
jgi:hypothetical protein